MCTNDNICYDNTCEHDLETVNWYRKSSILRSCLNVPEDAHILFGDPRDILRIKICIRCGKIFNETLKFVSEVEHKLNDYEFIKDNQFLRSMYAKNLYSKNS